MSVSEKGVLRYRLGVDVGGTFTDCVLADRTGKLVFDKAFSTPGNLADGVIASIENTCQQWGLPVGDVLPAVEVFKLGTTSPVNRLINRAGAPTALLTTRGHEDAVLIGRVQQKTDGLPEAERNDIRAWAKAEPLVARRLIYGVPERIDCSGEIVCPLNEAEVEHAVKAAIAQGVRAFAVCFLWAFANPQHEEAARRVIESVCPDVFVTLSSDVAPMIGEYERAATTILNSYLGPGTANDLASLEYELRNRGLQAPVFVMQSNGGVAPAKEAVHRPVYLLGSGPVGGVAAARERSRTLPGENVIATDMGGTSFDVGVVTRGRPIERRLSVHSRYKVLVSALEVTSVGAGGGSMPRSIR